MITNLEIPRMAFEADKSYNYVEPKILVNCVEDYDED